MNTECKQCGESKPMADFYKGHLSRDCRLGKCKDCVKADVRKNRLRNIEYYREYDRMRADTPHRVAARVEYQKTDRGREAMRRAKLKYSLDPIKRSAHVATGNAIRDGKLKKLDACEHCGKNQGIQAHHPSYAGDMALCVTWLCTPCHARLHKEHRARQRESA